MHKNNDHGLLGLDDKPFNIDMIIQNGCELVQNRVDNDEISVKLDNLLDKMRLEKPKFIHEIKDDNKDNAMNDPYKCVFGMIKGKIGLISHHDFSVNDTKENINDENMKMNDKDIQNEIKNIHNKTENVRKNTKMDNDDFQVLMRVQTKLHPKNDLKSSNDNNKQRQYILSFNDMFVKLIIQMFHSSWIIRHGSLIGLRCILKHVKIIHNNTDMFYNGCLYCISLMILDRFTDFNSDAIVMPIRETASQVLCNLVKYINDTQFKYVIDILLGFSEYNAKFKHWNIRYIGWLGLKYILIMHNARIIKVKLMNKILQYNYKSLKDSSEDVVNVGAQCLLSNIESIKLMDDNMSKSFIDVFTYCIENIDYDSSGAINVLDLLNSLLTNNANIFNNIDSFKKIFNILTTFLEKHKNFIMKQRIILCLKNLLEYSLKNNKIKDSINEAYLLQLFSNLFETILKDSKQKYVDNITKLKDGDKDEIENERYFKKYIYQIESLWVWLCNNIENIISELTQENDQLIMKLLNIFQNNVIYNKNSNDQDNDDILKKIPTDEILKKIENKKRKRSNDNNNNNNNPRKKRKLNNNTTQETKNSEPNDTTTDTINQDTPYIKPQKIVIWKLMDMGSRLLAKLFGSKIMYSRIVNRLIKEFLQMNENSKVIYGWKRILGMWLLSDCIGVNRSIKISNSMMTILEKLITVDKLGVYKYDEIKQYKVMMKNSCKQMVNTFKGFSDVMKDIRKYYKDNINKGIDVYKDMAVEMFEKWNKLANIEQSNPELNRIRFEERRLMLCNYMAALYESETQVLLLQASVANVMVNSRCFDSNEDKIIEISMNSVAKLNKYQYIQYRSSKSIGILFNESNNIMLYNNIMDFAYEHESIPVSKGLKQMMYYIVKMRGHDFSIWEQFWLDMDKTFKINFDGDYSNCKGNEQESISMLQIFGCLVNYLNNEMRDKYLKVYIEYIAKGVFSDDKDIQNNCIHTLVEFLKYDDNCFIMDNIIHKVVGRLSNAETHEKLGCIQLIKNIFGLIDGACNDDGSNTDSNDQIESIIDRNFDRKQVSLNILPYLSCMILPLLRCMTDSNTNVRTKTNEIFGIGVRLIPLEHGLPNPKHMSQEMQTKRNKDKAILQQLIDPSLIPDFKQNINTNIKLREYQQDGINWLSFLKKFHLHGILAGVLYFLFLYIT